MGRWSKFRTLTAALVFAAFAWKVGSYSLGRNLEDSIPAWMATRFMRDWIAPEVIKVWQLVAAINAVITIAYFFLSEILLRRLKNGQPVGEKLISYFPRVTFALSGLLSTYVIAANVWITLTTSRSFDCRGSAVGGPDGRVGVEIERI